MILKARASCTTEALAGSSCVGDSGAVSVREALGAYLCSLPAWQQDLANRVASSTALDDQEASAALEMVKTAVGLGNPGAIEPAAFDDTAAFGSEGATGAHPRLVELAELKGVGAVSETQRLTFEPDGLTVIYGQNGVGKTTYVRALKRICRTVDGDSTLHGNVYEDSSQAATVLVKSRVDGEDVERALNLHDGAPTGLEAMSVFCARSAVRYVEKSNAVAFVPAELEILSRLANLQRDLGRRARAEAEPLALQPPRWLAEHEATHAAQLAEGLGFGLPLPVLRGWAGLTAEEHELLQARKAAVAAVESDTSATEARSARADAKQAVSLANALEELGRRMESPAVRGLQLKAVAREEARRAVRAADREFRGLPVENVGGAAWKRMWIAAEAFLGSSPSDSDVCPLCIQPLDGEASQRLQQFRSFVASSLQQDYEKANTELRVALERINVEHVSALRTGFFDTLAARESDLHAAVDSEIKLLDAAFKKLCDAPEKPHTFRVLGGGRSALRAWAERRQRRAQDLEAAVQPAVLSAYRDDIRELTSRMTLVPNLDAVAEHHSKLSLKKALLDLAAQVEQTRSISIKQRDLTSELVTDDLKARLDTEQRALRCTVPVELRVRGAVGETEVEMKLRDAPNAPPRTVISAIASDGESRALALSFFLAETAAAPGAPGVVFDDPVSSLDDGRRLAVADRLARAGKDRQVIVFSHDLTFVSQLRDAAKRAAIATQFQYIWRSDRRIGQVMDGLPFTAAFLKARVKALGLEAQEWGKRTEDATPDRIAELAVGFYGRLRICWEQAVEEHMLGGVVRRHEHQVHTLQLDKVRINEDLIAKVTAGMTRCSNFVHAPTLAATMQLPERSEIGADLGALKTFLNEVK